MALGRFTLQFIQELLMTTQPAESSADSIPKTTCRTQGLAQHTKNNPVLRHRALNFMYQRMGLALAGGAGE